MNGFYQSRHLITSIEPRECAAVQTMCYDNELTEYLRDCIAAGHRITSVEPVRSEADEQAEFEAATAGDLVFG